MRFIQKFPTCKVRLKLARADKAIGAVASMSIACSWGHPVFISITVMVDTCKQAEAHSTLAMLQGEGAQALLDREASGALLVPG
jgi:hypothetical protein